MVSTLGKYSQLASAGEKARIRQAVNSGSDVAAADSTVEDAFADAVAAGDTDADTAVKAPATAKTTLTKAKRIKPAAPAATAPAEPTPDAPF
jgi:hypothetical protein